MSPDQEGRLLKVLVELAGVVTAQAPDPPTALPLTHPVPTPMLADKVVCCTGEFAYGPRRVVALATAKAGAAFRNTITLETDFLVVGAMSSPDWMHATYGRKIERAVTMTRAGHRIAVVDEAWWCLAVECSRGAPHVAD